MPVHQSALLLIKGHAGEYMVHMQEGLAQQGCSQESQKSCVRTAPLKPCIPRGLGISFSFEQCHLISCYYCKQTRHRNWFRELLIQSISNFTF